MSSAKLMICKTKGVIVLLTSSLVQYKNLVPETEFGCTTMQSKCVNHFFQSVQGCIEIIFNSEQFLMHNSAFTHVIWSSGTLYTYQVHKMEKMKFCSEINSHSSTYMYIPLNKNSRK